MAIVNMDLLEYKYQLILTSLSEVPLGELYGVYGLSYSPGLSQTGELSFTAPKYFEENGVNKRNVTYEDVSEDKLILIDNQDYYYIDSCKETNENGVWKKEVHAFRREYELNNKRFGAYEPETERFLYFIHPNEGATAYPWTVIPTENRLHEFLTSSVDVDGYRWGIFNEIERLTAWRLERDGSGKPVIPESLKTEVRMLSFSEENILEVLNKIQEAWNILFEYDTINRIIKIRTQEMFEDTPNGVLSDESFITTLSREIKGSEIKTRLFLYNLNGDGVTAERMAHGQPYIEDYSYYINNGYLTPHLVSALNTYITTLNTLQTQTFSKWTQLKSYYEEYKQTQTKIDEWEQELIGPLSTYDYYETIKKGFIVDKGLPTEQVIAEPRPLTPEEQASQNAAKTQITALERNIGLYTTGTVNTSPRSLSQLDKLIKTKKNELAALRNTSLMPNVFATYENTNSLVPGSLLREMEPFIRDAVYQSDSIEDSDDLYTEGLKILSQVSKPRIQFEMALVDFLSMVEFDHAWSLATLGQILRIESKDTGFIDNIMLLRYTHNPDEKTLTFEFSNDLKINNNTTFLAELISKSNTTASQVSFNANYWAQGGSTGSSGPGGNIFDNLYANYIQTNKLVAGEIEAERIKSTELFAAKAEIGQLVADSISANSIITDELVASVAFIQDLAASNAFINDLIANTAYISALETKFIQSQAINTQFLQADFGNFNSISVNTAKIEELTARIINTNTMTTNYLTAGEIQADYISTQKLSADYAVLAYLQTEYANIDMASITNGVIRNLFAQDLLATDGFFSELTVTEANIVSLDASVIRAGTITADKIVLVGPGTSEGQSLILALNQLGDLTATEVDTLNGGIITNDTITAEKIVAQSITTEKLAANAVRAHHILAGEITTAHITAVGLDAGAIKTGTLDATNVAIANLSATAIQAGTLKSINNNFYLDLNTGYFNLGGILKHTEEGFELSMNPNQTVQEYVEGKMVHQIYAMPSQIMIKTNSDGQLEVNHPFEIKVAVYEAANLVAATIANINLKDAQGNNITTTGLTYTITQPTNGVQGKITGSISTAVNLPTDNGTLYFTVTVGTKIYSYEVGWSKIKQIPDIYELQIYSSNGQAFKNGVVNTTLTALVYRNGEEYDPLGTILNYVWTRKSSNPANDAIWNSDNIGAGKQVSITTDDINERATFECEISE